MTDTADELRIIARDGGRLDIADRAKIAHAADELENILNFSMKVQAELVDANNHRIALKDKLREDKFREFNHVPDKWKWSTGWMKVDVV